MPTIQENTTDNSTASKKTQFNKRFNALKGEAENWKSGWKDMTTYIDPTRGLFDGNRTTIGDPIDHETLLDSHATLAKDIQASGLYTGMSDPSRPWLEFRVDDFSAEQSQDVKVWLDEVQRRILQIMQSSNIYEVLNSCYQELAQFGTGCFLILEDQDDVIRGRSFTCGEYFLGVDNKGRVNAFAREFDMTVEQLVNEFGLESVSLQVQADWSANMVDNLYKVKHLIESNDNPNGEMEDFTNMPFRSVYWEANADVDHLLSTRGFKKFRVIAPRWNTITTEMAYGYGSGWHAIGDIKELQVTHKDMLLAQEKLGDPPLQKDSSVQGHVSNIPGGITTVSSNVPNAGVRPLYEVNPNLESFGLSIDRLHRKIDRFFFVDLFLMINSLDSLSTNPQRTAFEIAERKAEKMSRLGPVLNKLTEELHDNMIENILDIAFDNSEHLWGTEFSDQAIIPEPPAELEGQNIKIRYISVLAQAQRAVGISQIERVVGFVGNVEQIYPGARHNINIDQTIREVADMEGAPAKIVRDKDETLALQEQDAQQAALAASAEMANNAADTTEKLAGAKTEDESALTGLMEGVG